MPDLSRPPECPLPAWKQALRFARDPLTLISECQRALGDVFCLRLPGGEYWTFITSPAIARQLFRLPPGQVTAGAIHSRFLGALFGTDAIFCLDGEAHRARQRLLLPLLSDRARNDGVSILHAMTRERAARWSGAGNDGSSGRTIKLLGEMHRLSLDFLLRLLFGTRSDGQVERVGREFARLSTLGARSKLVAMPALQWNLGRWSPWGRVVHQRETTRDAIRRLIDAARRERSSGPDAGEDRDETILGRLLGDPDAMALFDSDEALIDEIMNLLFAGHETTGVALTWCLEAIARHPEVSTRIRAELDEVVGDRMLETADLQRLPYLDAVIQEAFRFRPIGPFSSFRQAARTVELESDGTRYRLPAGDVIAYSFSVMCQRPDLFDRPSEFRPERFLDGRYTAQEWSVFGGGRRVCTGKNLAMTELYVVVSTLVRLLELEPVHAVTKVRRSGHLLAPEHGLPVRVRARTVGRPTAASRRPRRGTAESAAG